MIIVPIFNTTTAEDKAVEAGKIASPLTKENLETEGIPEAEAKIDE